MLDERHFSLVLAIAGATAYVLATQIKVQFEYYSLIATVLFPYFMLAVLLTIVAFLHPLRWGPTLVLFVGSAFVGSGVLSVVLLAVGAGASILGRDFDQLFSRHVQKSRIARWFDRDWDLEWLIASINWLNLGYFLMLPVIVGIYWSIRTDEIEPFFIGGVAWFFWLPQTGRLHRIAPLWPD